MQKTEVMYNRATVITDLRYLSYPVIFVLLIFSLLMAGCSDDENEDADKKALIVTPAVDAKLVKSAANIPGVKTATADSINTYEVLNGGKFVISVDAAKKLEEVFA